MEPFSITELMKSRRETMHITLDTKLEHISVNVWDELNIDMGDLDMELAALPAQTAYWIAVVARFELVVNEIKNEFESWYGPIYDEVFNKLEKDMGRKPNINSVEYMVRKLYPDEYNARHAIVVQAESDLKVVSGIVESLRVKMQSLIQLAKRSVIELDMNDNFKFGNTSSGQMRSPNPSYRTSSSTTVEVEEAKNVIRELRRKSNES